MLFVDGVRVDGVWKKAVVFMESKVVIGLSGKPESCGAWWESWWVVMTGVMVVAVAGVWESWAIRACE